MRYNFMWQKYGFLPITEKLHLNFFKHL